LTVRIPAAVFFRLGLPSVGNSAMLVAVARCDGYPPNVEDNIRSGYKPTSDNCNDHHVALVLA
jgi:hypothetical protein